MTNGQVLDLGENDAWAMRLPQGNAPPYTVPFEDPNGFMDLTLLHEAAHRAGTNRVNDPDIPTKQRNLWDDCVGY